eukprot:TRINITY_DN1871_c0_g1_i1.p1 TRINITY_DN1871_c0_g1~~TRINITY_DN1871_c0_g1_i1.p1  ORF type:complete len:406 (+),score=143.46 TRINITY_DN1871_c0_g1_i1:104-1321(+)
MENGEGRAAGRAPPCGRLRVGQIAGNGKGKSSIPSRFETILFTGQREKNGFGRRTHRFDLAEDALPGPGSYAKSRSLIPRNPGESKKGTGAFASASKIAANQPRALFITPGPGSYTGAGAGMDMALADMLIGTGPGGQPSASFAKPVAKRVVGTKPASSHVNPGPGAYQPDNVKKAKPAGVSVFSSKTKRDDDFDRKHRVDPVPGPGDYDLEPTLQLQDCVPSAVFKSPQKRKDKMDPALGELAKTLPQPPHTGPQGFLGASRMHTTSPPPPQSPRAGMAAKALTESAASREGPKPPPPRAVRDKEKANAKASSMFAATLLDRFGKPVVRYVPESVELPGPGAYESAEGKKRLLISSSWAMSSTERFTGPNNEKFKPPGPAFYNPANYTDRTKPSFHMNTGTNWV